MCVTDYTMENSHKKPLGRRFNTGHKKVLLKDLCDKFKQDHPIVVPHSFARDNGFIKENIFNDKIEIEEFVRDSWNEI